jgi:hypothetical protein
MSAPAAPTKEAPANGKAGVASPTPVVPPPVVATTRSRRGLYAGLLAVVGAGAVVVLITLPWGNQGRPSNQAPAAPAPSVTLQPGTRFDGGPDEGTRGEFGTPRTLPAAGIRFDGGPNEGTRGEFGHPATLPPGIRFDGGPDEGTRGAGH